MDDSKIHWTFEKLADCAERIANAAETFVGEHTAKSEPMLAIPEKYCAEMYAELRPEEIGNLIIALILNKRFSKESYTERVIESLSEKAVVLFDLMQYEV